MLSVIASIRVKPEAVPAFLAAIDAVRPLVEKEKGCIEYFPTIDYDSGLPLQVKDENVVTIIEKWEDLDALKAHLQSAHMMDYRQKIKDIVEDVSLKILKEPK